MAGDVVRVAIDLRAGEISFEHRPQVTRAAETEGVGASSPHRARARGRRVVFADMHCAGEPVFPVVGFESVAAACAVRLVRVSSFRAHARPRAQAHKRVGGGDTSHGGRNENETALFEATGVVAGDACVEAAEGASPGLRSVACMRTLLTAACAADGRGVGAARAATRALLRSLQESLCGTRALARLSSAEGEEEASAGSGPTARSVAQLRACLERAPTGDAAAAARDGANALGARSAPCAVSAASAASAPITACVLVFLFCSFNIFYADALKRRDPRRAETHDDAPIRASFPLSAATLSRCCAPRASAQPRCTPRAPRTRPSWRRRWPRPSSGC